MLALFNLSRASAIALSAFCRFSASIGNSWFRLIESLRCYDQDLQNDSKVEHGKSCSIARLATPSWTDFSVDCWPLCCRSCLESLVRRRWFLALVINAHRSGTVYRRSGLGLLYARLVCVDSLDKIRSGDKFISRTARCVRRPEVVLFHFFCGQHLSRDAFKDLRVPDRAYQQSAGAACIPVSRHRPISTYNVVNEQHQQLRRRRGLGHLLAINRTASVEFHSVLYCGCHIPFP